jgi:membrane-bound ClpP family serine protease
MSGKQKSTGLKPWLVVLIALLDDIAVLTLVFLLLWIFDVDIPLPAIIAIGIVVGAFVFIVHRAIVPSLRRKQETGAEGMLGLSGEVTEELSPGGIIRVKGEYWQAKSTGDTIKVGETVLITGIEGLMLEVKRKET